MDIRKIKKLIELLEESGLAEIEITEGEESVRIARAAPGAPVVTQYAAAAPVPAVAAAPSPAAPPAAAAAPAPARDENLVTAPMVGTFYAAPSPGAKAFVEVGQEIRVGQVLCVIEAMKMMNQIESERAGKLVAVLAKNGEPVEFGQPLFAIE
jgi:acetyl-CoA carboxylase biotin carboxyl carrier protein